MINGDDDYDDDDNDDDDDNNNNIDIVHLKNYLDHYH